MPEMFVCLDVIGDKSLQKFANLQELNVVDCCRVPQELPVFKETQGTQEKGFQGKRW